MSGRITAQIENQGLIRAEDPLTISNQGKTFNSSVGTINTNVFSDFLVISGGHDRSRVGDQLSRLYGIVGHAEPGQ